MKIELLHDRAALFHGDAGDLGEVLLPETVDAIVTDPPAGIGFMGKSWDSDKGGRDSWITWLATTLAPAFSALKPGGHALVWALPRTSHWTAMALEDAGFEIRDVGVHLFGTGFPKSPGILKPASEHWILARKPFRGTVAANVANHGTGAIFTDACRIGESGGTRSLPGAQPNLLNQVYGTGMGGLVKDPDAVLGRHPANVTLDETAATVLDASVPASKSRKGKPRGAIAGDGWGMTATGAEYRSPRSTGTA